MNDLIALGYGYYDLEGDFRWTQDKFNLYVLNKKIDKVTIKLRCSKVSTEYNLQFSTDNWKTESFIELENGTTLITIPTNNVSEVKFKCSSFIPAKLVKSTDFRVLGIQILTVSVQCKNNVKEIPICDVKLKRHISGEDTNFDLTNLGLVCLNSGWHELEEGKQRWTNGVGEFTVNTNKYSTIKLTIFSKTDGFLKVVSNSTVEDVETLFPGINNIYVELNSGKNIKLITDTFIPKKTDKRSSDIRELGIQLHEIELINDRDSLSIPMKNIFFDHDIPQLTNFTQKYQFKNENIRHIGGFGDAVVDWLPETKGGKLNLNNQLVFFSHRSGWSFVIDSLLKYHSQEGINFEGFLECPFIWNKKWLVENGTLPFKNPWVGVLHNPWIFPIDNNEHTTSEDLVDSDIFQESLKTCKGLYVLSKDLLKQVKTKIDVPVNFLYHPTEFVDKKFSMEAFKENGEKKILEVGSWLRKVNSLFMLNADKKIWNKVKIVPALLNYEKMLSQIKFEREKYNLNVTQAMQDSVKNISPLSDDDYDDFLTKNIVFVDIHASSANNAIIECIARGTPILINPLPPIVEYLGKDYPFYFNSIDEASDKVNNLKLVEETHQYLMTCPTREFIKKEYFLQEFENSSIYKSL